MWIEQACNSLHILVYSDARIFMGLTRQEVLRMGEGQADLVHCVCNHQLISVSDRYRTWTSNVFCKQWWYDTIHRNRLDCVLALCEHFHGGLCHLGFHSSQRQILIWRVDVLRQLGCPHRCDSRAWNHRCWRTRSFRLNNNWRDPKLSRRAHPRAHTKWVSNPTPWQRIRNRTTDC